MKICVAQTRPVKGNIAANVLAHQRLLEAAAALQADAVFFPELSLTGYEPELAQALALAADDARLAVLQELSDRHCLTIGVGAPTRGAHGLHISLLIFQPARPPQVYAKQQLHEDELPYFVGGSEQVVLSVKGQQVVPAICYESLQADHAEQAAGLGAHIYLASVAKSRRGVAQAQAHYPAVAVRYQMPVLMANCVGYCDNFESVGESAAWAADGTLLGQLDSQHEGLLLYDTATHEIRSRAV